MRNLFILILIFTLFSCRQEDDSIALEKLEQAQMYFFNGEYNNALESYKVIINDNISENTRDYVKRQISFLSHQLKKKNTYLLELKNSSNEYVKLLSFGDEFLFKENYKQAIPFYTKASQIDSKTNYGEANFLLSQLYFGTFDYQLYDKNKMLYHAKKALSINKNQIYQEQLGKIYLDLEAYQDAIKIFSELKKEFPANLKYDFYKGQALYFKGKESIGIELMKNAAEKNAECKLLWNEISSSK